MRAQSFTEELSAAIDTDDTLDETTKSQILRTITKIKSTQVNILITGAAGAGKSSTINALFNTNVAKVGQGVDPETMEVLEYKYENFVLFDSAGLGDGEEQDKLHAENIINKLKERTASGELLIDLVLVVLDGCTKDLGTSYKLINDVIIPNLGDDKSRLLVAINQADMAMKGANWNFAKNRPDPELYQFLDDKAASVKRRIKEATGVDVDPIYYAAGYKYQDKEQDPFNLSKLLLYILKHVKEEKRVPIIERVNPTPRSWASDDQRADYKEEIKQTLWSSVKSAYSEGAKSGGFVGGVLSAGKAFFKGLFG